jgi:hypothetical protein
VVVTAILFETTSRKVTQKKREINY